MSVPAEPAQTATDVAQGIATEVRTWLTRRRIPATRAAAALGVGQRYLARRLNGEVEFSGSELKRLALYLSVPVSAFFETDVRYRGT